MSPFARDCAPMPTLESVGSSSQSSPSVGESLRLVVILEHVAIMELAPIAVGAVVPSALGDLAPRGADHLDV